MLTGAVGANEAESGTERLLADSACQARARQGVAEDVRCHIFTEVPRPLRPLPRSILIRYILEWWRFQEASPFRFCVHDMT